MAEILVEICEYGYNEWVGPVYPEGAKPAAWLYFYSAHFHVLGLGHTYYAIPKTVNFEKMLITGGYNLTFS
jgi:uncharacterized protein YecE (DUF72 family)